MRTETIRAVDHDIATGVWPDMTDHGAATDAWPQLYEKVLAADILVLAGPIWLGDNSSVTEARSGPTDRTPLHALARHLAPVLTR